MRCLDKLENLKVEKKRLQQVLKLSQDNSTGKIAKGAKGQGRKSKHRIVEEARLEIQMSLLSKAQLVMCTLSGAGSELVASFCSRSWAFDTVIVDEAAQSTELTCLVALKNAARHCVLVGDPRQLPATVHLALPLGIRLMERSLFERLEAAGCEVHLLDTQYRMHPSIRAFPDKHFYQGRLKDGPNVLDALKYNRPFHRYPGM